MKITAFILLLTISSAFAKSSYSQNTRLTLHLENATIQKIFDEIQKKSEFIIFYKDDQVNLNHQSNVDVEDATVDQILDQALKNTNLGYKIIDRQIVILTAEVNESPDEPKTEQITPPQKKSISGKVIDEKGLPLPGVTVVVKGTTIGTITDIDGQFRLPVPADAKILVFSFVGMKSQEFPITGKTIFNVVLEEQSVGMEEVVVVGYGVQKKESVVGAISQIASADLVQSGNTDVTNAIAGKLSGVLTMQQNGRPGSSSADIIVRGLSSWNGSQPLTLIDGVERDFADLDPNEINTISVLKDASATAVFGAKGANGVIIVTTRRGSIKKPKLSFSASTGVEIPTRIPEHISSYTTMSMLNVANMNGSAFQDLIPERVLAEYKNPSTPLNALRYPDVDWYSLIAKPFAPSHQANINIEGGTKFVKYFASFGYFHEGSIFDGYHKGSVDGRYKYDRFNYRTNLDFAISNSTSLSFNIGGDIGITNTQGGTAGLNEGDADIDWRSIYGLSPSRFPAYFPAWVLEEVPDPDYPDAHEDRVATAIVERFPNPFNTFFNATFDKYLTSKLFTDLIFDQKLDFITKGLSFKGKVSLSTSYTNNVLSGGMGTSTYTLFYDRIGTNQNPWSRNGEGNEAYMQPQLNVSVGAMSGNYYTNWYSEMALNYNNTFGKHNISALALVNWYQKNNGVEFPYYNSGVVGRVTYNYSSRYLLELNVGYTGSERFAPANRFGFFPSAAIGWVVSNEKFIKTALPWVSNLKLRYSDGIVGSDAANSRWLYQSNYSTSGDLIQEDAAANLVAQWEQARKRDLGIELGFFENMIRFNLDLFDEYRTNMLLTPQTVTFLVGNSFKELNLGSMKKHGFEFEAEFNKKVNSNFRYFTKVILAFNENRIISKDDRPYAAEYKKQAGKPLGGQLLGENLTGSGFMTSVDDLHISPSPLGISRSNVGDLQYLDYLPDAQINVGDVHPIKGSTYAPITYSLSGGLTYKGFQLNLLFQGNSGKYINYNNLWEFEFLKGAWKVTKSQLDYWTPANPGANHATLNYMTGDNTKYNWAGGNGEAGGYELYLEGKTWRLGDYFRLKDVYLAYNFDTKKLYNMIGISNLNVYVTGNNLFTFTNLIEGDPERQNFLQGFYPIMTSMKLGLKVTF